MNIAICDDEIEVLKECDFKIKKYFSEYNTFLFEKPMDLEFFLENDKSPYIDIIIMDILFKDDNGIEAVKRIIEENPHIKVIYLTGFIDYVRDVFETDLVYFLLKPIEDTKLIEAIDKCKAKIDKESKSFVLINDKSGLKRIVYENILFVESDKRKIYVHSFSGRVETNSKLSEFVEKLDNRFIRCHQSFLVNMDYIREMKNNTIFMNSGAVIPVSRKYNAIVKEQFLDYFGELYE